ncbi:cysteine rich repeat-containing protein [bacterium]|nr:cysteine rich repeat-containing protein [bacterium]
MRMLLGMCLFLSLAANAQGTGPCAADKEKFCAGVQEGEGRIVKCLQEHIDELSPDCKTTAEAMQAHIKAAGNACKADIQQFCAKAEPGEGHILKCLQKHHSKLSPPCKDTIKVGHKK